MPTTFRHPLSIFHSSVLISTVSVRTATATVGSCKMLPWPGLSGCLILARLTAVLAFALQFKALPGILFCQGLYMYAVWLLCLGGFSLFGFIKQTRYALSRPPPKPLKRVADSVLLPWRWEHSRRTLPHLCRSLLFCSSRRAFTPQISPVMPS